MVVNFLQYAAVFCYVVGSLLQWMKMRRYKQSSLLLRFVVFIGAFCHLGTLCYIANLQEMLSNVFLLAALCSWLVVVIVFVSHFNKPVDNLFFILLPLTALILLFSREYQGIGDILPIFSIAIVIHIILSVLAYSLLMIATIQGGFFYYQEKNIKRHVFHHLSLFSSLETMESLMFEFMAVGVFLLTLSILSGFIAFRELVFHHFFYEVILSTVSWCIYSFILLGRYLQGWRGRKTVYSASFSFMLLLLSYFGSKILINTL